MRAQTHSIFEFESLFNEKESIESGQPQPTSQPRNLTAFFFHTMAFQMEVDETKNDFNFSNNKLKDEEGM